MAPVLGPACLGGRRAWVRILQHPLNLGDSRGRILAVCSRQIGSGVGLAAALEGSPKLSFVSPLIALEHGLGCLPATELA